MTLILEDRPLTPKRRTIPFTARAREVRPYPYLSERRAHRQYAEDWYQAIRHWRTRTVDLPSPSAGRYSIDRDLELVTMGQGMPCSVAYLETPYRPDRLLGREELGMLDEREVVAAIVAMQRSPDKEAQGLARFLDRAHRGQGLASLLREDGRWHTSRDAALYYALASLTLAVQLRDRRAEEPLRYVREVIAGRAP